MKPLKTMGFRDNEEKIREIFDHKMETKKYVR